MADLVQTPNGTFITRAEAEAAGLVVKEKRKAARKTATRKPTARKAAGVSRKGK